MDLENERKPIKPQKSGASSSRANEHTGMRKLRDLLVDIFIHAGTTNQQLAGFFQDMVMEKAMKDRVKAFARVDTPQVCFMHKYPQSSSDK